jgi:hypothetical protein
VKRLLAPFRRHVLAWALPLAVVLLNLAWLVAFGSGARLRAADLSSRLERARAENATVTAVLAERERLWIAATENRDRVEQLHREVFATESSRLTGAMREVRELAARSGLLPTSMSYPSEPLVDFGLSRRSFVFSVEGSYADLRTFLHLLELTDSFVGVDRIRVGEAGSGRLSIALTLSTLFGVEPSTPDGGGR